MLFEVAGGTIVRMTQVPLPVKSPATKTANGFQEIHVNAMEGVWPGLRSWLRPHRGVSQEKLPFYLAFFQFVHGRGISLFDTLM
jgi:transposase-like protein